MVIFYNKGHPVVFYNEPFKKLSSNQHCLLRNRTLFKMRYLGSGADIWKILLR